MKKNKKSTPTEKKFWIISIAIGICLVVLAASFFSNADKEKEEADLLDTVNYVKVQCSTYTHYNESSESKSLLRAIEGTRQVSKNIAAETFSKLTRLLPKGGLMFVKLNPYYEEGYLESFGFKPIANNLFEEDGVLRYREVDTASWKQAFEKYYEIIRYLEFPYPWQEGMNRLFLLQKK